MGSPWVPAGTHVRTGGRRSRRRPSVELAAAAALVALVALALRPGSGVRGAAAGERRRMSRNRPPTVRPVMHPRLAGEGVWHATQARFAGLAVPPLLVTTYRPDPSYPRVVAGLAWINSRRATVSLYSGIQEPPVAGGGPGEVPSAARGSLLATFNSGFRHKDGGGGYFVRGR